MRKLLTKRVLAFLLSMTMLFLIYISPNASVVIADNTAGIKYVADFKLMEVPDPFVGAFPFKSEIKLSLPDIGKPYFEPNFGTIVTRATTQNPSDLSDTRHEYSRFDAFNSDKTMIMLGDSASSSGSIYRTNSFPYNKSSNFVIKPNIKETRWDPNSPDFLWGLNGLQIVKLNVITGQKTIEKDFANDPKISPVAKGKAYWISTDGEGESSIDKRYWALFLENNSGHAYIFTYDLTTDTVVGLYPLKANETAINWIGMSSLGNYVLLGGEGTANKTISDGLVMANRELTRFNRIDTYTSHSDVGLDSNGKEVVITINSYTGFMDMIYLDWSTKMFTDGEQSYVGTGHVPIVNMYPDGSTGYYYTSSTFHVSGNYPGYALLSMSISPDTEEGCWLDKSIILVKLDPVNPRSFYVAKTYDLTLPGGVGRYYWDEVQASISNDGSKVVWACNWNLDSGKGKVFMMQADLPVDWDKNNLPIARPTSTPKPTMLPTPTIIPTPSIIKVITLNKVVKFSYAPTIVSGVIMAQADLLAKALSATYKYNSKTKYIIMTKGKVIITMKAGSRTAKVGSKKFTLAVAPKINKVMFLPLKFVVEKLGYIYTYNKLKKIVTISKRGS